MSSVACRVCLRTNVPTLELPYQLKTFHDELCDFETVQHKRLKYCASCAHQMKKCYKFKGQCLRANGLLKLWIKHENKDISEYHKELPSPSLQITNNSTSFLFECQHDEKTLHNTNVTTDCNRNMVLKLNTPALAPDDRMLPESSKLSLNSNPCIPDQPDPDLRPAVRLSSGLKPALRPNIGSKPAFRPNLGLRPSFRPNFTKRSDLRPQLKTEHVKAENGMLTIDPNLLSVKSKPALRPNLILTPALKPNPRLGLSIQLVPSGHEQLKPTDLTLDPDFDVSYETDPISVGKESANTMDIVEEESLIKIKQQVYMDDNTVDIDDAIASEIEIEPKEADNNECTIASTMPREEKLNDNDTIDNTIDNKEEELTNNQNDTMSDIDSDEYTYEYLDQDIHLLDFVSKPKQKQLSEATSIEKKQAEKSTVKEPQVNLLIIKNVSNQNILQPAQNETNIPLEAKCKQITRIYANKTKIKLTPEQTYRSPGFKAVPTFKDTMFGLFDDSPFVLEDETVLTKELFSVIYDKFSFRELKRLAIIVLEDDFRAKLTAYLGVLYRKYNPEYESIFHVEYLHTEEKKKEEFKRRELHPDYIRAAYKCELCYKTYTGQSFVDYHKKIYHDPAGPLICSICSYSMPTRTRLIKHRLQAHQAAYSCKLCPLRTNLVNVMRNHYKMHKGAQYECPICFKIFYHENTLRNHKRKAHATHVCLTCAQQYTTEKGLRIHRETQHKDDPPVEPSQAVPCTDCDITFDTRQSYQRHCIIGHTPLTDQYDPSYPRRKRVKPPPIAPTSPTSPTSPKENNQDSNMEKQVKKKKKNEKVYRTCEICNEKVEKFGALMYKHFLDKHPGVPYHAMGMQARDFLCDECGKSFTCRATLRDHKNSHTGLRPYMCEICPARFHTKGRLWSHRGQYHCGRSHRCEECGKLYKNATHLQTHMKIHIGDRRFKCHICNKDFLYNSSLKEHVKGVHNKERRVRKIKKPAKEV